MSDYAFREKTRVPVVHTYRLADCITSVLRSNSTKDIRAWLYLYHSAKGRWFVFLFASKVFQERHCAPSPLRMYRYGKQGRLSFQGCKPPCCICPICVWCVLFRIPLKLRPYKVLTPARRVGAITPKSSQISHSLMRLRLYRPA